MFEFYEEMTPPQKEMAWIGGGIAVATILAIILYERNASASSAVIVAGAPTGTAVVTTPSYVQSAQTVLAQFITNKNNSAVTNGTPQMAVPTASGTIDPTTTAALQSFQTGINQEFADATSQAQYQTKYGTAWVPLRTDGVLDGNTYQTLMAAARDDW